MNAFIVSYDLCAPGRDYTALYKKIQSYPHWARITESTWFVHTNSDSVAVRDNLFAVMDPNDRLFVAGLTGNAAWRNCLGDSAYLKRLLEHK